MFSGREGGKKKGVGWHNTVKLLINVVDSAAASALVNVLTSSKVSLIDREQREAPVLWETAEQIRELLYQVVMKSFRHCFCCKE